MDYQKIKDMEYAKELGYDVDINVEEQMEFEMEHLFDYELKTKEYLETLYV